MNCPVKSLHDLPPLMSLTGQAHGAQHTDIAQTLATWARDYLCSPHPDLGRNGPVCPFVPAALQKQQLYAVVYPGAAFDTEALREILLKEKARFVAMRPESQAEALLMSLMVVFPDLRCDTVPSVIDLAQSRLQPDFVVDGLMVGEFHAVPPPKGGLWNEDFRPLHCPVPMLVIRHMVATDLLFLTGDPFLFAQYRKFHGEAVPERFRSQFDDAAERFGAGQDCMRCAAQA